MSITDKETLQAINNRHMHAIDKMYRMFAGLSSHLLAYEEGTLTLQVHHSKRWTKDPRTTAKQLAKSWILHNPEFKEAHTYSVYVHASGQETGAVVSTFKKEKEEIVDELFTAISKASISAAARCPLDSKGDESNRIGELIVGRVGVEGS